MRRTGLIVALLLLLAGTLSASAGTPQERVMTVISGTNGAIEGAVETLDGTITRTFPLPGETLFAAPAADGSAVAYGEYGSGVWFVNAGGKATEVDASPNDLEAAISPDGSKIAFVRYHPENGSTDIYTVHSDGSDLKLVASGQKIDTERSPQFSPDGSTIAYGCDPVWHGQPPPGGPPYKCGPLMDGSYRPSGLMLMNADGSNKRLIVIGSVWPESWSPDGKWLAWAEWDLSSRPQIFAYSTSGSDLFKLGAPNRQITHQTAGPIGFPSFSPDGADLLYMSWADSLGHQGNFPYLISRNGKNPHELPLKGDGWTFVPPPSGSGPPPTVDETKVTVPDVRGMGYEMAIRMIRRAHFQVGSVYHRFSARVARNHLIATRPRGGLRFHRSTRLGTPWVALVVSRGARR